MKLPLLYASCPKSIRGVSNAEVPSSFLVFSRTRKSRQSRLKTVNTFCQVSLESSHSRTHIPSGGGCGDVHPLQGLLRSASISLPRLAVPPLPGAQGSTAHNGPGPSQCNMSDRWSILRLWASFCGHVRVRSLLLVRTSCGTIIKTKLVRDARQWKEFNM